MKRFMTATVAMLMVATMFISCATAGGAAGAAEPEADVEIISVEPEAEATEGAVIEEDTEEEKGGWLNSMGSIEGLDVQNFRLRGEGPDGASFGWVDVKGTKVALSDIRRGEWDLYAEAIGKNGQVVATGHLKTFLSDSTPLGTLFLSEETGTGDVTCDFGWTTTQVLYPSIEVYVKTENGDFMARDPREITIDENGHAVWTAKDMPAGSYIVRALLKDEGEVVSGVAAALRVIDDKVSVGNCKFIVGKLSTVYGIDLQNSPINTVQGEISLQENALEFVSDVSGLRYSWFLDGFLMDDFRNVKSVDLSSLELKKGFYRFDCIASSELGFSSINTETAFVYSDGNGNYSVVTEDQADSKKGDVPEGYMEVATKESPEYSEGESRYIENEEGGLVFQVPAEEHVVETGDAEIVAEEAPVDEVVADVEAEADVPPVAEEAAEEEVVVAAPVDEAAAEEEVVVTPVAEADATPVPPGVAPATEAPKNDLLIFDLGAFMPFNASSETIRP